MSEKFPFRKAVLSWLESEGHVATVIDEREERFSDIRFQVRGTHFYVIANGHDPGFLYITLRFNLDKSLEDEQVVRRAATAVQDAQKVVKLAVDWEERTVNIATEQFIVEGMFAGIFWRSVDAMSEAARAFFAKLEA